jgi:hypothetical protein
MVKTESIFVCRKSNRFQTHSQIVDSGKQSNSHKTVASTSKNSPTPQRKAQAAKKQRNSIAVLSPGNKREIASFQIAFISQNFEYLRCILLR